MTDHPNASQTTPAPQAQVDTGRRNSLRLAGAAALGGAGLWAVGGPVAGRAWAADVPPLTSEFLFTADVQRGTLTDLGPSKLGHKRVGTIDGGTFEGPRMKGVVLPGGGYFQTIRDTGSIMLHTEYLLKTDDGVTIYTRNEAVAMTRPDKSLYVRAWITFEAPADSAYAWLHDFLFVGSGMPNMETNTTDLIVYQIL
jgi:hypothetical protein